MTSVLESEFTLGHLLTLNHLDHEQFHRCQEEVKKGSNVINALSLFANDTEIWRQFALESEREFHPDHRSLRVMFSDLMTYDLVLRTGLLPHRERGPELQVVTYDPGMVDGPHPAFPGRVLKHALIPPSAWRTLFDLAYPQVLIKASMTEPEAVALVTFTQTGASIRMTPEQRAEVIALTRGYRFIDVRTDPVDPEVIGLINLSTKAMSSAYPHHLEGGNLVVLMSDPEDQEAIDRLYKQTRLRIIPAIVTRAIIDELLKKESAARPVEVST
ncbi:hypothetical protein [Deinococcus ficus]|uniref:Type II secretion system protein GspE N-terminal domain-containing protein n=1 Tax=Deinococcus ficus TaxID=317577 RepID=A0A221T2X5_9DEIO|nr:hypothetical protein [Deinococcus ficus]ASN83258.1 hypothetical protein DFI_18850 [Deinococcus ficus]